MILMLSSKETVEAAEILLFGFITYKKEAFKQHFFVQLSKGFMYWNLSLRINSLIQAIAALTLAVMLMTNGLASANNWGS